MQPKLEREQASEAGNVSAPVNWLPGMQALGSGGLKEIEAMKGISSSKWILTVANAWAGRLAAIATPRQL